MQGIAGEKKSYCRKVTFSFEAYPCCKSQIFILLSYYSDDCYIFATLPLAALLHSKNATKVANLS